MAAKLANQGGARNTGERVQETVLCQSYASVLNPKSASQNRGSSFKGNNKENIDDQATVSQQPPQSQQQQQPAAVVKERIVPNMVRGKPYQRIARCQSTQPNQPVSSNYPMKHNRHDNLSNTHINAEKSIAVGHKEVFSESHQEDSNRDAEQLNNGDIGDGEFQTVAPKGARRKEKMREQNHRERHRLRENNRHQQPRGGNGAGSGGIVRRGSVERSHRERGDRNGVADHNLKEAYHKDEQNVDADQVQSVSPSPPVKYVEAPLPVVNPWTKNKALMSQIAPTSSQQTSNSSLTIFTSSDRQSEKERRVLQPQQQQQHQHQHQNQQHHYHHHHTAANFGQYRKEIQTSQKVKLILIRFYTHVDVRLYKFLTLRAKLTEFVDRNWPVYFDCTNTRERCEGNDIDTLSAPQ